MSGEMVNARVASWIPAPAALVPPVAALIVQWLCWSWLQPFVWFLFYPAVFLSAWIGGRNGGLWATLLSALAVWYVFLPPILSFSIHGSGPMFSVLMFLLMGGLFSEMHQRMRMATQKVAQVLATLQASNEALEAHLRERITELEGSRESMRQNKARFKSIIGSAMDAIISVDESQRVVLCNAAAQVMFQCPEAEALGQPMDRFMPMRFRNLYKKRLGNFAKTGLTSRSKPSLGTLTGVRANGQEFPIEASIAQAEVGNQKAYTVILRDISERKHAEDALRAQKEQLRIVTENARLGLVLINQEHRYVYCNQFYADIVGRPISAIVGNLVADVIGQFYETQARPGLDKAFSGERVTLEVVRPDSQGTNRSYSITYESIPEDGVFSLATAVITDVTEKKRLDQEREKMVQIIEHSNDFIATTDPEGNVTFMNSGGRNMIGLECGRDPTTLHISDYVPEEWHSFIRDTVLPTARQNGVWEGEMQMRNMQSGVMVDVFRSIFMLRDATGRPFAAATLTRDITERKRAEAALKASEEQLHAADRRLAEIVQGMTEACFALDKDWRFTFVNDQGVTLLQRKRDQMVDRTLWETFSHLAGSPIEAHYRRAMAERVPVSFEAFSIAIGRWLDIRLFPTADGLAAFLLDIDARKQAENTLRTKQLHAQSLLRLARNLERALTLSDILHAAREEVEATLGMHALWFYLLSEDRKYLQMVTASTEASEITNPSIGEYLRIEGDPMLEEIATADNIVVVEDARIDPRTNKEIVQKMGSRTIINMPVSMAGKRLGTIGSGTFGNEGVRTLTPTEQRFFAALGSHMAVVIDRVQAMEKRDVAEAALREAAKTQTAILNALPAHIALVDPQSVILAVNESWRRFATTNSLKTLGFCVGENYVETCENAVGDRAQEALAVAEGLRGVLSGSRSHFAIEYPCHSPTEERWFRLMVTPVRPDEQAGAVVMHVDITERKKSEATVHNSEERFRQLAQSIHEVFWVTSTTKHEMLYISPAYERIWGRSCESLYLSPQTWLDAIHPDDRAKVVEASQAKQAQGTYDEEYRIIRPDGSVRWINDRAFPVHDASGNVYRVAGVAQDISERKLAGDRLAEQASLLDKARDAILVRNLEHGITYWNKSAERLYGWTPEEAVGCQASDLLYQDATAYHAATDAVIKNGEWQGELQQVTKSGSIVLIEARWTLVRDDQGQPKSILSINTDITEKKKLERQFLRAQRMESIGTLAGGIAHDLNNVLAPIMMSIDLLKLTSTDKRAQAVLSTIEGSARRGADMVQQILSFARGVEGQRVTIDARQVIREIQHLVQDTFPKNIRFNADLPEKLPTFQGDHTQLHQVLLNLCVNARDAMPMGGELMVSARHIEVDDHYAAMNPGAAPRLYVLIKVLDSGTGMPREVIDKIFDPFFTTKDLGKGTGLGLSTVLAIVKSHGGFLNVYSEPGKGTTFSIYLPANLEAGGHGEAVPEGRCPRGNDELVLIVDDEAAVRTIAQQTLENYGYRVLVAADGAEAISLYSRHHDEIAAVLTDMMMPVMDGPATIQVIQQLNPKVKIIAASGLASEGGAARATAMGVKHVLLKPYTAQAILTILQEVLEER
ncbi:MAG: sensory box protein [Verrucomicrobiaceae bacterium]|nr:sensory box protein [Verrucomicrobiaceae bacterium]